LAELNAIAAHNVIIDAISSDLSTIDDFTFSGITLKDFETHDCLGSTFYFYAYLKSGYSSLRFHLPPATIQAWVEERLRTGNIAPYIDKELAAIGLGVYALCKFHRGCPNVREEFCVPGGTSLRQQPRSLWKFLGFRIGVFGPKSDRFGCYGSSWS
jgi:hypothetical protein